VCVDVLEFDRDREKEREKEREKMCVRVQVFVRARVLVFMCICMFMCACVCVRACVRERLHVCVHARVYDSTLSCSSTYIDVCVYVREQGGLGGGHKKGLSD